MYLAKEMINDSLSRLSSSFGGKTHSTLLHAWKKVAGQVEKDETLRRRDRHGSPQHRSLIPLENLILCVTP